jgi:hypothetical protein
MSCKSRSSGLSSNVSMAWSDGKNSCPPSSILVMHYAPPASRTDLSHHQAGANRIVMRIVQTATKDVDCQFLVVPRMTMICQAQVLQPSRRDVPFDSRITQLSRIVCCDWSLPSKMGRKIFIHSLVGHARSWMRITPPCHASQLFLPAISQLAPTHHMDPSSVLIAQLRFE